MKRQRRRERKRKKMRKKKQGKKKDSKLLPKTKNTERQKINSKIGEMNSEKFLIDL
jgi:hypothetical protein